MILSDDGETCTTDYLIRDPHTGGFRIFFVCGESEARGGDGGVWVVEDGQLKHPLKNFTLIGNGPDAMSKIIMVGSDFAMSEGIWTCGKDGQNVPVGVGLPTVLISEMTVGGM